MNITDFLHILLKMTVKRTPPYTIFLLVQYYFEDIMKKMKMFRIFNFYIYTTNSI